MTPTGDIAADEDFRQIVDSEGRDVIRLGALLSPAAHIDSRFLRNFRMQLLPGSDAGLEARFWHSSLVGSRSLGTITLDPEIVLELGRRLFEEDPELLKRSWKCIESQHEYLPDTLRLQEALRFSSITGSPADALLARVHKTLSGLRDGAQRRSMGRWLKTTLPELPLRQQRMPQVQWLASVAAAELGDAPESVSVPQGEEGENVPVWLFPRREEETDFAYHLKLSPGVLAVVHAEEPGAVTLPMHDGIPVLLYVTWQTRSGNGSGWLQTRADQRLTLPHDCRAVELVSPDGRRFRLWAERSEKGEQTVPETSGLILLHRPDDRELADRVARLLRDRDVNVRLREEDESVPASDFTDQPVVCLWSKASAAYWDRRSSQRGDAPPGVLLRTAPDVPLPEGMGESGVFDLFDFDSPDGEGRVDRLLKRIRALLDGPRPPADRGRTIVFGESGYVVEPGTPGPEIESLLTELNDADTTPARRLEIGDRLAELGDPRPGVGVREHLVDQRSQEHPDVEVSPVSRYPADVRKLLDELADPGTEPPRRLEIGDELDRRGDPRPGVGLDGNGLPAIDWVKIPGGRFIYQDGESVKLPDSHISRFPMTNRQYQAFVDDKGYDDDRWWQDLKKPKQTKSIWQQGNRPRTNVDWYEAVAFTRWLSAQLGYEVRLPTEQEWERVARGREGRDYPWGGGYRSGFANVNEKRIETGSWDLKETTAVGMYPQGASIEGVLDLAGNVWEWCLNKVEKPEVIAPDKSGDSRVLRGGSWISSPGFARAAVRVRYYPDNRRYLVGFRVLSSAPIAGR
ncbi:MAG: formylglycine-generating enzyme family protein [Gammaproteobacteria bacterium]|nr:formylglycine-generating enzyme family protein [Gammaproteobacteria bacterium]